MKATKKIVGATAALVAAVALSAGSTFAWFATSGSVSVDGMKVQVQTADNLLIRDHDAGGNYSNAVNYAMEEANKYEPVSTIGGNTTTNITFYHITNRQGMTIGSSDAGTSEIKETTSGYLLKNLDLMLSGESSPIYFKPTVTAEDNGAAINNSIRIMLVINGGETTETSTHFIYSPIGDPTGGTGTGINAESNLGSEPNTQSVTYQTSDGSHAIISGMEVDTAYLVNVYVWFEGEDPDCTAIAAALTNEITIKLEFSTSALNA